MVEDAVVAEAVEVNTGFGLTCPGGGRSPPPPPEAGVVVMVGRVVGAGFDVEVEEVVEEEVVEVAPGLGFGLAVALAVTTRVGPPLPGGTGAGLPCGLGNVLPVPGVIVVVVDEVEEEGTPLLVGESERGLPRGLEVPLVGGVAEDEDEDGVSKLERRVEILEGELLERPPPPTPPPPPPEVV